MVDAAAVGFCISDIVTAACRKSPAPVSGNDDNMPIWCTSALKLLLERNTPSFLKVNNYHYYT